MRIGTVELTGRVVLAPMAGVTDFAFRELCRHCGAALTTTEMVSARALTYGDLKSRELLWLSEGETPAAVQIFGHEPTVMAEAAQMAAELSGAAILDINMGCPVGKIVKSGDGSALMKDPELASRIVEAVAGAVSIPVTVKFRKGWDNGNVNAVEFARCCEQAGAAGITVHGRTRAQLYAGRADWDIIREVKKAVTIPVTANGDVFSGEDAAHLLRYTGCDAVMIGRGCFGDPWLFSRAKRSGTGAATSGRADGCGAAPGRTAGRTAGRALGLYGGTASAPLVSAWCAIFRQLPAADGTCGDPGRDPDDRFADQTGAFLTEKTGK